ncbi:putative polygalacturonase [Triticum urartu]|uniref:Putative polygalacturonase n=1 Tax=Triticum urartu TaxID=4572 RepID=M7ZAC6_TRIUA|nr:putative polygalacturonase [Triticum urartu]
MEQQIAGEEEDWKYDSSDEDYSYKEDYDGEVVKRKSIFPRYNNDTEIPHFALSMVFRSKNQLCKALTREQQQWRRRRRHPSSSSLVSGSNLTDVVITGNNGTIDGQGATWWSKYKSGKLKYTRGYLIELMHTDGVFISNVTLVNSPAWNIHPVYSRNIVVSGVTILAPTKSPNTDGINPDSCSQVRIEDCYVVSGDDCVAIKSGWDEYGIAVGMPSEHIVVRRLTCVSPTSAGPHTGSCPFPTDTLAVDQITVQQCSYSIGTPASPGSAAAAGMAN